MNFSMCNFPSCFISAHKWDEMTVCLVRLDIEGGAPAMMLSPVKMLQWVSSQRRRNAVQLDARDASRDVVHVPIQ
jgi:hypothetical protein